MTGRRRIPTAWQQRRVARRRRRAAFLGALAIVGAWQWPALADAVNEQGQALVWRDSRGDTAQHQAIAAGRILRDSRPAALTLIPQEDGACTYLDLDSITLPCDAVTYSLYPDRIVVSVTLHGDTFVYDSSRVRL